MHHSSPMSGVQRSTRAPDVRLPVRVEEIRTAVALSGVVRVFGRHVALAPTDLIMPRGQVLLLWGPNGAGKSTLLHLIATALSPSRGHGRVLGFDLLKERTRIRASSELLGHRTRLYEDLTPAEYLEFVATLWSLGKTRQIRDVLARAGLAGVGGERIRSLSHGMRQRLALARCELRRPELLLLDEPYTGLDEAAKQLVDELVREAEAEGRTVILATHDTARGARLAGRAVRLETGRIVEDAPPPPRE